jgi:hypothetical protein
MTLLGASTAARIRTLARVDKAFALRSFSFSLDPGTGAVEVDGTLGNGGRRLELSTKTKAGTRTETRDLDEPPALSLNLSRRLAAEGLKPGQHITVPVFDPATLRNAPMTVDVEAREVVRAAGKPVPAFRVRMEFAGITSTSWVTDVGEVVREESGMGLIVVKETRDRALALAVPGDLQKDMLEVAAVAPAGPGRIDDPRMIDRLRLRVDGLAVGGADLQGAGQTVTGDVIRDPRSHGRRARPARPRRRAVPGRRAVHRERRARDPGRGADRGRRRRRPAGARRATGPPRQRPHREEADRQPPLRARGPAHPRGRLQRAHRPLRGHGAARSASPPASRWAWCNLHGAFLLPRLAGGVPRRSPGRGLWLPVDPTLNEFPADATHVRLARGGLDKQAAILPLIGRIRMSILEAQARPGTIPVLLGRAARDTRPIELAFPRREGGGPTCWSRPAP